MAADMVTAAATNVRSDIIGAVVQKMEDAIKLEKDLNTDFSSMKTLLIQISNQFQSRQKRLPEPVERCLERMKGALVEAKDLIDGAKLQPEQGWCLPSRCFFGKPDLSSKIRVWKARFDALLQELEMVFPMSSDAEQIVSSAAPRAQRLHLLPAVPDFVGSGIQSARTKLQKWLTEPRGQARVIGVYGTAGVGKTSLLKIIYNTYRKEVSGFFDVVIWFTVSRNFEIEQLQASIAEALNLSLEGTATETLKMKLNASLERKRFLLVLDNVSSKIDLNEVGIRTGDDNGSKLLISSRSSEVVRTMGERDFSLELQPLSPEEGWDLFRRGAFTNGVAPENKIETAREMASHCKGLPLVINVVAAAMSFKKTPEEWSLSLTSMKKTSTNKSIIDPHLDQLLIWSYHDLSDRHLQICFLNCAAFLEDQEIVVETLVEMWDAEGLLKRGAETPYLMDAGRQCINVLVSRRLVECVEYVVDDDYHSVEYLKIHEVLRDMAIEIGGGGQTDKKCLFQAGQKLQSFPSGRDAGDCKRISVGHNDIHNLPTDLNFSKLESLVLASNIKLEEVPEKFFSNIRSLKVLDLSCTSIRTLPASVGELTQLEFLNLSRCSKLVDLPDTLGNLSSLKVLNLNSCLALHILPSKIGMLKDLKHLKLDACYSLRELPQNLSQLTSLNTLILPLMESTCAMGVEDLSKLSNLMELTTVVKSEIEVGTMNPWLDMRKLTLEYDHDADADRDAVTREHVILQNMGNMKKLQNFQLVNYQGVTLPNSICELEYMKMLLLHSCYQLKALPSLDVVPTSDEIRSESAGNSFSMLEKLVLRNLLKLESIARPSGGWNEGTMSKLQLLVLVNCPSLKTLPLGMKLPCLKELHITMCNQLIKLDIGNDGFPMLEMITLDELNSLESIEDSYSVWDERTMSKLQILEFIDCPLLKRLPLGLENLSSLRKINGELDWWQRITWQNDEMKAGLSKLFMMI